jgi:probable rRNA maturation factor
VAVRVVVEGGPYRGVGAREVGRRARRMLVALQMEEAELSLVLTNDEQIHKLNATYRKKDKPTDVLAFAQQEAAHEGADETLLGDVIVSVPTARRQAKGAKHDVLAEVTMLVAHGLLHLLGWDHDTDARDRKMRAKAAFLCAAATKNVVASRSKRG